MQITNLFLRDAILKILREGGKNGKIHIFTNYAHSVLYNESNILVSTFTKFKGIPNAKKEICKQKIRIS